MLKKVLVIAACLILFTLASILLLRSRVPEFLARNPYLESLTDHSAAVLWVSDTEEKEWTELSSKETQPEQFRSVSHGGLRTVHLTDLTPQTVYTYRAVSEDGTVSDEYSFKTAPPSDSDTPVRFFVLGDSGKGNRPQHQIAGRIEALLEAGRLDFGLHTGDIIYGDWPDDSDQDERYFSPYRRILPHIPFWLTLGNHDAKPGIREAILDAHELPGNERWYSFDYGPVHVNMLDSNLWESQEQRAWLQKDLSASSKRPWTIAVFHHPPYAWPYADREDLSQGSYLHVRQAWSPIFEQYGVDIVFTGHSHSYQRTRLIKEYEPEGDGLYYIITGGGGGRLHSIAKDVVEPGLIEACAEHIYHFVYVEIDGNRLSLETIDRGGEIIDRFSFRQASPPLNEPPLETSSR